MAARRRKGVVIPLLTPGRAPGAETIQASLPSPPVRQFSFTDNSINNPTTQQPGNYMDSEYDRTNNAVDQLITFNSQVFNTDGTLRPGTVGEAQLDPSIVSDMVSDITQEVQPLVDSAQTYAQSALSSANAAAAAESTVAASAQQAQTSATQAQSSAYWATQSSTQSSTSASAAAVSATNALNAANDADGDAALCQDYGLVTQAWAEHMPDTIPPNILAVMNITGDHWSSRWWANRAANAFGMLAWYYLGAWAEPGPPTAPYTPTGDPIPIGGMYFDTTNNRMMVWTGDSWIPLGQPTPAVVASLYYKTTAGQTVFPLTTPDLLTHSQALANGSGVSVYLNGVRLTPDDGSGTIGDYTVNIGTSTVTLLHGAQLGFILAADVLVPPQTLAPGAVEIKGITPITPNGSTTVFTLTCADATPLNMHSPYELLVSVDGVIQQPQVAYQTSTNTITFNQAPAADSVVFMQWFMAAGP